MCAYSKTSRVDMELDPSKLFEHGFVATRALVKLGSDVGKDYFPVQ